MPTVLVCGQPTLEQELAGGPLGELDCYFAAKPQEARTMTVAARPELVLVDRDLPWAESLLKGLREDPTTRRVSIAILAKGDFDPGEIALLEAGANAVLRLPPDGSWDARLRKLLQVAVRKAVRVPVSFAVDALPRDSSAPVPAMALNLSVTGLLLESSFSLAIGDEIGVEFQVPGEKRELNVRGRVMRLNSATQFGIEFTTLDDGARESLERFVAAGA